MAEGVLLEMWGNNFLQYLAMLLMLKGHCMLWLVRSSYYTCRMRKAFLVQQTRNSTSYAFDFIGGFVEYMHTASQPSFFSFSDLMWRNQKICRYDLFLRVTQNLVRCIHSRDGRIVHYTKFFKFYMSYWEFPI